MCVVCHLLFWQRLPAPGLPLGVDALLVVQQDLHSLHILLIDGVQQRVLRLHLRHFD